MTSLVMFSYYIVFVVSYEGQQKAGKCESFKQKKFKVKGQRGNFEFVGSTSGVASLEY